MQIVIFGKQGEGKSVVLDSVLCEVGQYFKKVRTPYEEPYGKDQDYSEVMEKIECDIITHTGVFDPGAEEDAKEELRMNARNIRRAKTDLQRAMLERIQGWIDQGHAPYNELVETAEILKGAK